MAQQTTKNGYRSFVDVETIPATNSQLVGTGSCVALVSYYTRVGQTSKWKQGARVKGNHSLKRGTAIATFVNGTYPNHAHGNHAALYISQDATLLWVVDQWSDDPEYPNPHKRALKFLGKNPDGTYKDPSNNGDAFSVIDL